MNKIAVAFAGLVFASALAQAGDMLDAAAIKALITDKTLTFTRADGKQINRNYFSPDGKIYRMSEGKPSEGTWKVTDDGKHCVEGIVGGCGIIESNGDGTYTRVNLSGGQGGTWSNFINGKDF